MIVDDEVKIVTSQDKSLTTILILSSYYFGCHTLVFTVYILQIVSYITELSNKIFALLFVEVEKKYILSYLELNSCKVF